MGTRLVEATTTTSPSRLVLACEATGKLLSLGSEAGALFLAGRSRAFCSEEVAAAHLKLERERGTLWLHQACVRIDPARLVQRLDSARGSLAAAVVQLRDKGFTRPLLVRRTLDHQPYTYELRAGFRIWQAAQKLKRSHLPAEVVEFGLSPIVDDLLEKLASEDLQPLQFAQTLQQLLTEGIESTEGHRSVSQREIARWLGISQSHISDLLSLLHALHPRVRAAVERGELQVSKAVILKQLPQYAQVEALDRAMEWNSRALRRYIGNVRLGLVGEPRHKSRRASRMQVAGRGVKVRSPRDIAKALVFYEDGFFAGDLSLEPAVRALQYVLSIIDRTDADIVLPADVLEGPVSAKPAAVPELRMVKPRAMPLTVKLPAIRKAP